MEWALEHIIEIIIGGLFASLGAIGVFQMRHNNMSDDADKSLANQIDNNRKEIDEKHTHILSRMEHNQKQFADLHSKLMEHLADVSVKLTETHVELHATNQSLNKLADTVTYVIRDEIPKINNEINSIKLRQAHYPLYQEYIRQRNLSLDD